MTKTYDAIIVADSYNRMTDARCTTFEITLPKWLVAEFNTHRMLARNSASSRAVPTATIINQVLSDPVIPLDFRAKNTGMEATEKLTEKQERDAEQLWISAAHAAVAHVRRMMDIGPGIDKQRVNRLLEPFMWTTIVATATEWDNFFKLRDSTHAQPEFACVAHIMHILYQQNTPREVKAGDWHLPYVPNTDGLSTFEAAMRSAARCGRVSYFRQLQETQTIMEDVQRATKFKNDKHMSPLEHPCLVTDEYGFFGHSRSFKPLRKFVMGESGSQYQGNWVETFYDAFEELI